MAVATRPVDPAKLAGFVFGHDLWETPQAILREAFKPHARVAIKSCHASGKTHTVADAVLLALLLGGDVITTAPTWTQVEQVLWGQVARNLLDARIPLPEWGAVNRTEIRLPTGEFALGLSTDVAVRFQGYHARDGRFLLVVFDEAPGVRPDIYTAVEGIRAGGDVRQLYLGNPTVASGPFFDVFAGDAPGWYRQTISAFDTPNLHGLTLDDVLAMSDDELDTNERPYLITRRFVREKYEEWGPQHPEYQSRVMGQFPLQSDDSLLSLAWLEAAALRPAVYAPGLPVQAGVDVAGPGDDETVLCIRQGDAILDMQAWALADSRGAVVDALRPWRGRGLDAVNVDVAGMGHYFALALEDAGLPVVRVNVGEAPTDDKAREKYANLRAQVFWTFREWVAEGMLSGLTDRTAISQLAGLRYAHDVRGKVKIERKVDARKRGVKSPDRAEAVALAFWSVPRQALSGVLARSLGGRKAQPNKNLLAPGLANVSERQRERSEAAATKPVRRAGLFGRGR